MTLDFRYLVEVLPDGTINVHTELPNDGVEVRRIATPSDVVHISQRLAYDVGQQLLVEQISNTVLSNLMPQPAPEVSDKVREALKDRGITPEQGAEDTVN
jgi:hypothetical protein